MSDSDFRNGAALSGGARCGAGATGCFMVMATAVLARPYVVGIGQLILVFNSKIFT